MKITAILPIFNEEKTVKGVLATLESSQLINEIIVVNDASTDKSEKIIKSFSSEKLTLISLKKNLGKGDAVKEATKGLETDIIFLCDGDLHNFETKHIKQILLPLLAGHGVMSAGLRDKGIIRNFFDKHFGPLITGERALPCSVFKEATKHSLAKGFGLEPVLNDYCQRHGILIQKQVMKGVQQTFKPKKYKGGSYRLLKQIIQIFIVIILLRIKISK